MARSAEQRSFIRHFHDSAKVHNSDTAGDMFDYRQIVRDKDVGQSKALLQVAKQVNAQYRCVVVGPQKTRAGSAAHAPARDRLFPATELRAHAHGQYAIHAD